VDVLEALLKIVEFAKRYGDELFESASLVKDVELEGLSAEERKGPLELRVPKEILEPGNFVRSATRIGFDELWSCQKDVIGIDGGVRSVNVSGITVGVVPVAASYESSIAFEHPSLGLAEPMRIDARSFFAYVTSGEDELFKPLIDWRKLAESTNRKELRDRLSKFKPSLYNRPTMLDENRLIAETKALEFASEVCGRCLIGLDGPLFPTPSVLMKELNFFAKEITSLVIVKVSYLYNFVKRYLALKRVENRVFSVTKRLNKSQHLAKYFGLNNDQELMFLVLKGLRPGIYVWGPIETTLNLRKVAIELSRTFGYSQLVNNTLFGYVRSPKIDLYGEFSLPELINEAKKIGEMRKMMYYVAVKGVDGLSTAFRVEVLPNREGPSGELELVKVAVAKALIGSEVIPYPAPILHADEVVKERGAILKEALVRKAILEQLPVAEVELE